MQKVLNGRYELRDIVGAGGAATVYRGTDRQLHREVAVKLLDDVAARSADPGGRARFLREARAGAAVRHRNLVDIFDAGEDDGSLFLVMELVPGQSLAELIAIRAPLPVDEAVGIAAEILAGLSALHATGTIHRDVKPANILVDDAGHVRLTDFGIAKRLDDIEGSLTSDDLVVGTPTYIAPEQAAGRAPSPATDVYGVGLVLYEMLTGDRAPERGYTAFMDPGDAVAADPRSVRPEVPDHVAAVVARATHLDPDCRYADAAAMAHALAPGSAGVRPASPTRILPAGFAPIAHHEPTRQMPAAVLAPGEVTGRSRKRRRAGILVAALVACVLFVGVISLVGGAARSSDDTNPTPAGPAADVTVPAATPLDTVPPATMAPEAVAPAPAPPPPPAPAPPVEPANEGDTARPNANGKANGNGKENGRDKKDD